LALTNENNVYVASVTPTAAGKYEVEATLDGALIGGERRQVTIADRQPSVSHTLITPEKVLLLFGCVDSRIVAFRLQCALRARSHCMLVRKTVVCSFNFATRKASR
jgi:hypothetical protein